VKPLMVLVAGPYRSGTNDDPVLIAKNVEAMTEVSLRLFRAGHLPVMGEWYALPLIEHAGSKHIGDPVFNEIFHPISRRLVAVRCLPRIGGPSAGADEVVALKAARQGRVLRSRTCHGRAARAAEIERSVPTRTPRAMNRLALAETLPDVRPVSRVDATTSGERRIEPSLGADPLALLVYDRSGHFARRHAARSIRRGAGGPSGAKNNSQAQGGYDAYFGTYTIDEAKGHCHATPRGLAVASMSAVLTRAMHVVGDTLVIA
jgi:hypothetical protein